jgi:hypothetical protein
MAVINLIDDNVVDLDIDEETHDGAYVAPETQPHAEEKPAETCVEAPQEANANNDKVKPSEESSHHLCEVSAPPALEMRPQAEEKPAETCVEAAKDPNANNDDVKPSEELSDHWSDVSDPSALDATKEETTDADPSLIDKFPLPDFIESWSAIMALPWEEEEAAEDKPAESALEAVGEEANAEGDTPAALEPPEEKTNDENLQDFRCEKLQVFKRAMLRNAELAVAAPKDAAHAEEKRAAEARAKVVFRPMRWFSAKAEEPPKKQFRLVVKEVVCCMMTSDDEAAAASYAFSGWFLPTAEEKEKQKDEKDDDWGPEDAQAAVDAFYAHRQQLEDMARKFTSSHGGSTSSHGSAEGQGQNWWLGHGGSTSSHGSAEGQGQNWWLEKDEEADTAVKAWPVARGSRAGKKERLSNEQADWHRQRIAGRDAAVKAPEEPEEVCLSQAPWRLRKLPLLKRPRHDP